MIEGSTYYIFPLGPAEPVGPRKKWGKNLESPYQEKQDGGDGRQFQRKIAYVVPADEPWGANKGKKRPGTTWESWGKEDVEGCRYEGYGQAGPGPSKTRHWDRARKWDSDRDDQEDNGGNGGGSGQAGPSTRGRLAEVWVPQQAWVDDGGDGGGSGQAGPSTRTVWVPQRAWVPDPLNEARPVKAEHRAWEWHEGK